MGIVDRILSAAIIGDDDELNIENPATPEGEPLKFSFVRFGDKFGAEFWVPESFLATVPEGSVVLEQSEIPSVVPIKKHLVRRRSHLTPVRPFPTLELYQPTKKSIIKKALVS